MRERSYRNWSVDWANDMLVDERHLLHQQAYFETLFGWGLSEAWGTYGLVKIDDAETNLRQNVANKGDLIDWLHQHLCIDDGVDLSALFDNAVGVQQGTMTAIFLDSPGNRKSTFDSLLQVEDYENGTSYLNYAFNSIDFETRAANNQNFVATVREANEYYVNGMFFEANVIYIEAVDNVSALYTYQEIEAAKGDNLAFLANDYASTIQAIREANDLAGIMKITRNKRITIPTLD